MNFFFFDAKLSLTKLKQAFIIIYIFQYFYLKYYVEMTIHICGYIMNEI